MERNQFGELYIYEYNEKNTFSCISPFLDHFQNQKTCPVIEKVFNLPDYPKGQKFQFQLCKGVLLGTHAPPGFPTFNSLKFNYQLKNLNNNIFGGNVKYESLIIEIQSEEEKEKQLIEKAKLMIGKICYVNWPYLKEALVVGISHNSGKWSIKEGEIIYSKLEIDWKKETDWIQRTYLKKAININKINILVHVKLLNELQYHLDGSKSKKYFDNEDVFPIEMIKETLEITDNRFIKTGPLPFEEKFPCNLFFCLF